MIGTTRNLRVWAYPAPADLRKGFDGLSGLVLAQLQHDVRCGDCFLFTSRCRKSAKVLVWDGTGLCIYHKRLERGRFGVLWRDAPQQPVVLTLNELSLYLEGCTAVARIELSPPAFTSGVRRSVPAPRNDGIGQI